MGAYELTIWPEWLDDEGSKWNWRVRKWDYARHEGYYTLDQGQARDRETAKRAGEQTIEHYKRKAAAIERFTY